MQEGDTDSVRFTYLIILPLFIRPNYPQEKRILVYPSFYDQPTFVSYVIFVKVYTEISSRHITHEIATYAPHLGEYK